MDIVVNTSAEMDAELDKLAVLEGKSREEIGHELAMRNFLENMQVKVRAARKAALMRVLAPVQDKAAKRPAYAPIDWAAADRPAYAPINWKEI